MTTNTASVGRLPIRDTLFGRFFNQVETTLDRIALIAARNGDVPYFGL